MCHLNVRVGFSMVLGVFDYFFSWFVFGLDVERCTKESEEDEAVGGECIIELDLLSVVKSLTEFEFVRVSTKD